jgi:hypothetical protein
VIYLISTWSYGAAKAIAREKGLKDKEWKHIPLSPKDKREEEISGREATEEYLLGYFSTPEREYLKIDKAVEAAEKRDKLYQEMMEKVKQAEIEAIIAETADFDPIPEINNEE